MLVHDFMPHPLALEIGGRRDVGVLAGEIAERMRLVERGDDFQWAAFAVCPQKRRRAGDAELLGAA